MIMEDGGPLLPSDGNSLRTLTQRARQERRDRVATALPGLYGEEPEEEERQPVVSEPSRPLRRRLSPTDVEYGHVWVDNPMVRLRRWIGSFRPQVGKFALVFAILMLVAGGAAGARTLYRRFYGLDAYGLEDPSRVYRDRQGRLIVDPWHPRILDPSDEAMTWIVREARFWRLRASQIRRGWARVLLHGASRSRNVSLCQLEDTLRASGHRCTCAAHAGVPVHALYDRDMDVFMVEPKFGKESSEMRKFLVKDLLSGEDRQLRVPGQLWVDYVEASGTKHLIPATGSSVACVVQCSEIAIRGPVVDPEGAILRDRSWFDRDR